MFHPTRDRCFAPERSARHLHRCDACTEQLAAFQRVVRAARSVTVHDVPVPPPRRVWDALIADVSVDAGDEGDSRTGEETPATPGRPAPRLRDDRVHSSRTCAAAVAMVGLVLGYLIAG